TTNPKYVHGAGTSGATGFMSLDDVTAHGREPDVFELLQAGILSGSLGAPGTGNNGRDDQRPLNSNGSTAFVDPDDKTTLQILRIGANIIDQWDVDSFPTTITYTYASPTAPSGFTSVSVEGIEDLPYPYAAYLNIYSATPLGVTGSGISTPEPPFDFYLYFALWNPHQTPASPVAANYPTALRLSPYYNNSLLNNSDSFLAGFINSDIIKPGPPPQQVSTAWFYYGPTTSPNTRNGPANNHTPFYLANVATSTGTASGAYTGIPFTYSPTSLATEYREPTVAIGSATPPTAAASIPTTWKNIACLVLPSLTNFPSANAAANQGPNAGFPPTSGTGSPNSAWQCQYYLRIVMPIQYQDTAGNWHTYGTLIGMDDPAGAYLNETAFDSYGGSIAVSTTASLSCPILVKSDPRTFRFGLGGGTPQLIDVNVPAANDAGLVSGASINTAPFVGTTTSYRLDLWADNDGATPTTSRYADVDGVQRWGDARNSYQLGTHGSPLFSTTTTPSMMANRPVILNRPFQSVGELGYAYRDMPWKTLDLFSATSADSGLLDLFTLSDAPMLAGRINPNTPYAPVAAALISGATQSSWTGNPANLSVTAANAQLLGAALTNASTALPFVSRADVVNNFMTNSAITSMSAIKTEEEAAVRSVAESSNTRTWNFMIDIIAQSGRYPTTAASLDNFVVEGERRYWLHIAIDRYTGQVVDKQLEVVNE
ncbi:MAG TPA: hypothetical protein VGC39_03625, partial [Candidatus Methylacidiphilales bacterium]